MPVDTFLIVNNLALLNNPEKIMRSELRPMCNIAFLMIIKYPTRKHSFFIILYGILVFSFLVNLFKQVCDS